MINIIPPRAIRDLGRLGGPGLCIGDSFGSFVDKTAPQELVASIFIEIEHLLLNEPFKCARIALGQLLKNGQLEVRAGEIAHELQLQDGTLKAVLMERSPISFELAASEGHERKTIGVLPIGESALILLKGDRQSGSNYGLDSHFLCQVGLAVKEALTDRLGKGRRMQHAKRQVDETADALLAAFEREQRAFEKMLPELLRSCKGWYVALHSGDKVDQDADEIALARRVERRFKHEFVLVTQVLEEKETAVLDSPEG